MTQSYSATKIYSNDREKEARVHSNRCLYTVWLSHGKVSLAGPGVDECCLAHELPLFDSFEDLAVYVTILFENGLWPEE